MSARFGTTQLKNRGNTDMIDKRVFLKVKLKSLMAESKIIRHIEDQFKRDPDLYNELHYHRVGDVRHETRLTHLAYGFIRGRTKDQVERSNYVFSINEVKRIDAMVKRYGTGSYKMEVKDWLLP